MTDNTYILKTICQKQKTAYLIFDPSFRLIQFHTASSSFFDAKTRLKSGQDVREVLPLLHGLETAITLMLEKKQPQFCIERVNRESGKQIHYFDLWFSLIHENGHANILCLCIDVTEAAVSEQEFRQQKYELELTRTHLLSTSQFLTDGLLGNSTLIEKIRNDVHKIAQHRTTVLIQGESGTGKSLVAKLIHNASYDSTSPFIEINCAAIPDTLIESELFGYEKGAFTNAVATKKGLLEEADGGTLFLDEIGELPITVQAKLLNVLENRAFRRLGSTSEIRVTVQLIAATNKNLLQAVQNQEFRQDLFYRINIVSLQMPALRELGADILILALHFIHILAYDFKKKVSGLTEKAKQKILHYTWPGNVRELRNVIERAMIFSERELIDADDLVLAPTGTPRTGESVLDISIPEHGLRLEEVEQHLLKEALQKANGNQSRAASLLGLSLDTFRYRTKKFGILP